jgi:hypothetical protein
MQANQDLWTRKYSLAPDGRILFLRPLGELANEGNLSVDERAEYEALINAADFISILKLKAKRHLDQIPQ